MSGEDKLVSGLEGARGRQAGMRGGRTVSPSVAITAPPAWRPISPVSRTICRNRMAGRACKKYVAYGGGMASLLSWRQRAGGGGLPHLPVPHWDAQLPGHRRRDAAWEGILGTSTGGATSP